MRFAIETWAPEYGAATDHELPETGATVDAEIERDLDGWAPIAPPSLDPPPERILFTDGVRRVDAQVWIEDGAASCPGICATFAAGAVLCDGRAEVVSAEVRRGLFTAAPQAEAIRCRHVSYPVRSAPSGDPDVLSLALQQRMGELEITLAAAHDAPLVIVDGPLRGRQSVPGAVGYIKTHHVSYLQGAQEQVVAALGPGQRTPVFLMMSSWSRFSWYLRLPGSIGHPWAGVVRCEASADHETSDVIALADAVAAALPRFSSKPHKDPRAPQNLYPIAGLERELRRRLGDAALLYRDLRVAAA
ncbi:MAG: hypothetical protein ACR2I4_03150 [Actinomycetota bacterium]|nr:hypothetical protein [Actinomycetota bacterium]MDQ3217031.1 hypothetical protein [Actinomycetota bacterium]